MQTRKLGLILTGLLLLTTFSPLLAAEKTAETTGLTQSAVIQSMQDLTMEREAFAHGYNWGERAEYPQRLQEYNSQMQAFHLEEQYLRLDLYHLQGDVTAAERTAINIEQLENGIHGTDRQLPRETPVLDSNAAKGGTR